MKKTSKNGKSSRFPQGKKNVRSTNMKNRTFQLETLEARQLLSGVSFDTVASGTMVESDTFYATVGGMYSDSTSATGEYYVAFNIADTDGKPIDITDIKIEDMTGNALAPAKASTDGQVTTLLLKMGMGTDYTISIDNFDAKYGQVYVLFTLPGDADGNGQFSSHEYNLAYGQMLQGMDLNAATVAKYLRQTGIDLTKLQTDASLDLDGDGRVSTSEFSTLVLNTSQTMDLKQEITVVPKLTELKWDGETLTPSELVDGSEVYYSTSEGGNRTLAGTLPDVEKGINTVQAELKYMSGGVEKTVIVDDMQTSDVGKGYTYLGDGAFEFALTGVDSESEILLTFSYVGKDKTDSPYTIVLDSVAPVLTGADFEVQSFASKIDDVDTRQYWNTGTPAVNFSFSDVAEVQRNWTLVVLANETVYYRVEYRDGQEKSRSNYTALPDGTYNFKYYTVDALGNSSAQTAIETVTLDTTKPTLEVTWKEADGTWKESDLTHDSAYPVTIDVTEANGFKVTVTVNEVLVDMSEGIELSYGKNTVVVKAQDPAGNSASQTKVIYYNEIPTLTEAGSDLQADGHVQLAREDAEIWSPAVADFFDDEAKSLLDYTVESSNSAVGVALVEGELVFTYTALTPDQLSYNSTITLTATDEYNDEVVLTFDLLYTRDDAPPVVTLDLESCVSPVDDQFYAITGLEAVTINGNVAETTGIENAILTIYKDGSEVGTLDLVAGTTAWAKVTSMTAADADGDFSFVLDDLAEGVYTFGYTSKDTLGKETDGVQTIEETLYVDYMNSSSVIVTDVAVTPASPTNAETSTFSAKVELDAGDGEHLYFQLFCQEKNDTQKTLVESQPLDLTSSESISVELELAEGEYTFSWQIVDFVENLCVNSPLAVTDYIVDRTAPVLAADGNTLKYTAGTVDSELVLDGEYYATKATVSIEDLSTTLGLNEPTDVSYFLSLNGATATAYTGEDVTLVYGKNTLVLSLKDAAGNVGVSKTFVVHWNEDPTTTAAGDELKTDGFTQNVPEPSEALKTLALDSLFQDDAALTFEAFSLDTSLVAVTVEDGKLVFAYGEIPTGEISINTDVTVVATDEYGKSTQLTFNVLYTLDSDAPCVDLTTIQMVDKDIPILDVNNSWNTDYPFVTRSDSFVLKGTLKDTTDILSGGIEVLDANENVVGSWVATELENPQDFSITMSDLEDGTYTVVVRGRDSLGNDSTEEGLLAPQTFTFIVDTTVPTLKVSSATLVKTGTSTDTVNTKQPSFVPTFEGNLDEDVWIVVMDQGDDTSGVSVWASSVYCPMGSPLPTTLAVSDIFLQENQTHQIIFAVLDVAGNSTYMEGYLPVVVDLTKPVIDDVTFEIDSDLDKVSFDIDYTDANDVSFCCNGEDYVLGSALDLVWGENTFVFTCTDEAGNVSEEKTKTIAFNHAPKLTSNELPSQTFDLADKKLTIPKATIEGLFSDEDIASGDSLEYTLSFEVAEEAYGDITASVSLDGTDYVVTLTGFSSVVNSLSEDTVIGTLKATACDEMGAKVSSAGADVTRTDLDLEESTTDTDLNGSATQKQSFAESVSYLFDMSEHFTDPEGNPWTLSSAKVLVNGEENGTTAITGRSVSWTPTSEFTYGTISLEVTATDGVSGRTTDGTATAEITWGGVVFTAPTTISVFDEGTIAPTVSDLSYTNTNTNGTVTYAVEIVADSEEVHGYALNEDGSQGDQYESLFLADSLDISSDGSMILFMLNENAYGAVTLKVTATSYLDGKKVGESSGNVSLTVDDVVDAPYAPDLSGTFQLSKATTVVAIQGFNSGADEGDVGITTLDFGSENAYYDSLEQQFIVMLDGYSYFFDVSISLMMDEVTLTKSMILDAESAEVTDANQWLALSGTSVEFEYTVQNATSLAQSTGKYTLEFTSFAKNVSGSADRATLLKSYTFQLSELCTAENLEGWKITGAALQSGEMSGSEDLATATIAADGQSVTLNVPAYGYGELICDFTVSNETDEGAGAITLSVDAVNFVPEWAADLAAVVDGKYVWTVLEDNESETVSYTLSDSTGTAISVQSLFYDSDTTTLTIALQNALVNDAEGNRVGVLTLSEDTLTFTPDEKEFTTSGVNFALLVSDTSVASLPANEEVEFSFKLVVTAVNDAPVFGTVPVIRGEIGTPITIQLKDYLTYVTDVDSAPADLSIVPVDVTVLSETDVDGKYTFTPTEMGSYSFVIKATDGVAFSADQTVNIAVGGYVQATIKDASLDVTLSTSGSEVVAAGAKLTATRVLSEDLTLPVLPLDSTGVTRIKAGSLILAGSVLRAGTTIPKNATFSAEPILVSDDAEMGWDSESGAYNDGDAFTLAQDWTLNCDMQLESSSSGSRDLVLDKSIRGTTEIKAGSTLLLNTLFATETTVKYTVEVPAADAIAGVVETYTNFQTKKVDISEVLAGDVAKVTLGTSTQYEVSVSGTTFTLTLKDGGVPAAEWVVVEMESGTQFSIMVEDAATVDVASIYAANATVKTATTSDGVFQNVVFADDVLTLRFSGSTSKSGVVSVTMSNDVQFNLDVANDPVYPFYDIALDMGDSSVSTVSFESLPANSCFSHVEATATGIRVYYEPYQVTQDRSPVNVLVELANGTPITVEVSTEYEKPFTFHTTLKDTAPDSAPTGNEATSLTSISNIANTAGTYYLEVWAQCNLPTFQDGLTSVYQMYAFTPQISLTANSAAVSGITALKTDPFQMWKVEGLSMNASATYLSVLGSTCGSGADGSYARVGLYQIDTTGEDDLDLTVNYLSKAEFSILFDNKSNIGVYAGSENAINSKQTVYSDTVHYNRASSLRGTQAATETVVEGTGVYLSVTKEASASETAKVLPKSEASLTEWDSSYVELWLNTQDAGEDLSNVSVDLLYNADLFTATGVEYSSLVSGLDVTIDDATGRVTGIGGDLTNAVTNADGFVLLARVKLESLDGDGIAADAVGSADMGLVLDQIAIRNTSGVLVDPNTQVCVNTKAFAVVYDADDSGAINLNDLIELAKLYGVSSVDSIDARVWAMDFDNSGEINLNDLISFAKNYGIGKADAAEVMYPEGFFQQWIGKTLNSTGDASVADTLESALSSWEVALGEALDVDVQIIVKEMDNSSYVLGETVLVGLDSEGAPATAVVYLDSDALGMGWYVGEAAEVPNDQYDLYTTLLHELGHALGFNASYTGYTGLVNETYTYTDEAGLTHFLSTDGHSWEYEDLMFSELATGVRKEVSALDAEIVGRARSNGGVILSQTAYSVTGTISGMVDESAWNTALLSAAMNTIQTISDATDAAWADYEEETPVVPASSLASESDELFDADELDTILDEITLGELDVTLD